MPTTHTQWVCCPIDTKTLCTCTCTYTYCKNSFTPHTHACYTWSGSVKFAYFMKPKMYQMTEIVTRERVRERERERVREWVMVTVGADTGVYMQIMTGAHIQTRYVMAQQYCSLNWLAHAKPKRLQFSLLSIVPRHMVYKLKLHNTRNVTSNTGLLTPLTTHNMYMCNRQCFLKVCRTSINWVRTDDVVRLPEQCRLVFDQGLIVGVELLDGG